MDKIEEFSAERNLARVSEGFRGGDFFSNPVKLPARRIVDGYPAGVEQKSEYKAIPKATPMDPWNYRRTNAKL